MNLKKLKKVLCLALSAFMLLGEAGSVTTLAAETENAQEQAVEETEAVTEEATEGTEEVTTEETTEVTEEATEEVEETETETEEVEETETEEATEEVEETEIEETTEEVEETEEEETEEIETVGDVSTVGTVPINGATTYSKSTNGYQKLYYKVTVQQKGYLTVTGKGLNADKDYGEFAVYDASLRRVADDRDLSYNTSATSGKIGVEPGTYYVKWSTGYYAGQNVQFSTSFTASNTWESEYNDTFQTADAINVNTTYYGSSFYDGDGDQADYFKFTTSKAGYVSIDLTQVQREYPTYDYYYVKLYNANYTELTNFSIIGGETSKSSVKIGLAAGTYYVLVQGTYRARTENAEYSFKVNWTQTDYWEKELNSSLTSATNMALNKQYGGTIRNSSDEDYYKFTLSEAGAVSLTLKHALLSNVSSVYYYVTLYNADGTSYYVRMSSKGSDTSLTSTKIGLASGTYYIKVESGSTDTGVYTLQTNFSASSVWETEFNDAINVADKVSVNKEYNGALSSSGDVDYYKFSTSADGYITLNFKHANLDSGNYYFKATIMLSSGTELATMYSTGFETSKSTAKIGLKKGTYYIKITDYSYSNTPYKFKVNYTEASNWEKEDNGSISGATKISLGKDYNGTSYVDSRAYSDYDYYKFSLDKKSWINISFKHANTGTTSSQWSVYVIDGSGNTIYSDINKKYFSIGSVAGTKTYASTGNIQLGKGTYYIKIYGSTSAEPYKINVSNVKIKTPTISSVKSASYNSIKVSWKAVAGADEYYVYRSDKKDGSYKKVKTLEAGATSYTDKKLTTGKKYYYKLKCSGTTNKKTTSGYSEIKGAKPVPATPKVTLASSTKNQMKVSWKQISGATGYEVWRTDKKDGKYSKLTTISKAKTVTYTDKKAKSGKTYYYKVRAYKTVNGKKVYSSYSSVVSKKTK